MHYDRTITLRDGRLCRLRSGAAEDAADYLDYFITCHGETDFLTTYPDETQADGAAMAGRLGAVAESPTGIELLAVVDGRIAGSAGIGMLRDRDKTRHRAGFGISVLRPYWGLGVGSALTAACIDCARRAGFLQIELEAVADNETALRLYRKHGFTEYGRNPRGFRTREGRWQELVLMRLELPES